VEYKPIVPVDKIKIRKETRRDEILRILEDAAQPVTNRYILSKIPGVSKNVVSSRLGDLKSLGLAINLTLGHWTVVKENEHD
jgi:hypothetical protein